VESKTVLSSQDLSPKPQKPWFLIFLLGLVILILVGEGVYLWRLKKTKTTSLGQLPRILRKSTRPTRTDSVTDQQEIEINIKNDYPSLNLEVDLEKIEAFLLEHEILPGKNCHLVGKDKDACFLNDRLKIKFTDQETVEGKAVRIGSSEAIHFSSQQGQEKELVVAFRFDNLEEIERRLLQTSLNRSLLNALLYASHDKDQGAGDIMIINEKFDQAWSTMQSSGDYFLTVK